VSRSKHTRPDRILAASRVRDPHEPRGQDDQSSFRRLARVLKESGIVVELPNSSESGDPIIPRIIVKRPRQGFVHPAEKADIVRVLQFFGERCFYGLRLIKLVQGSATLSGESLLMGRLEVPGTIVLYDQPASPWFVTGSIPSAEKQKLERAGASIEVSSDNLHCLIHWTDSDLKNFMLFEVFMHEIGHHLIQQYKGKRSARVARTKDHEHFADLFAERCRESFFADHVGDLDA
jgi:hypothetical protein